MPYRLIFNIFSISIKGFRYDCFWSRNNITKLNKEADFIDKEFLTNQKAEGISRKLVAFELVDRGIPRHDYFINDADGNDIGIVTSGTMAPSLGKAIGMGYVTKENSKVDSEVYIAIRNKKITKISRLI